MKLKFNSDLSYQHQAIHSVVGIFRGQKLKQSSFSVTYGEDAGMIQTDLGISNHQELSAVQLLENVQEIQTRNGLPRSEAIDSMNFSVEMETGTGKTYVYLRTIYELNKQYGFSKFIVVVPSVAIREGVHKSLQITKQHFSDIYDRTPLEFFIYDSDKLDQVRHFAASTTIQVMIINIDAFRKSFDDPEKEDKANVIHRAQDRLNGFRPIEFIQQTNPIVIIDEPQSVDTTAKAKEAISSLNPLCTLRYSATHAEKHQMLYRLDAVDAYNERLVKKIEVMSVRSEKSYNIPYIRLIEVKENKAKIELDVEWNGKVKRLRRTVKWGDDLFDLSGGRDLYRDFIVQQIDWTEGNESVEINGYEFMPGQAIGEIDEDEIRCFQITKTIEEHLDKELRFLQRGLDIKVLSLFFIDKVTHYRDYDKEGNPVEGKYAKMFEEQYKKLIQEPKYHLLLPNFGNDAEIEVEKLHDGYFARDKKGKMKDTKGNTLSDNDVYSLIMKDKERLLSREEPLRFIFSHSALREGWDNPNVFQICTLKDSGGTYTSRRQEIGRGLRLAVNQNGERISDHNVNILTVIANESYEEFVSNLQKEMEEQTGITFGIIEKHIFAKLAYFDKVTEEPTALGYALSKKLYELLKAKSFIDKKDKATAVLKKALENNELSMPSQFAPWKAVIIRELRHFTSCLPIKDASKKKRVQLNEAVINGQEIRELWEKIQHRTVFFIGFDSRELIRNSIAGIQEMPAIAPPRMISRKKAISGIDRIAGVQSATFSGKVEDTAGISHALPDIITELQNRLNLTRRTIVEILTGSNRLEDFKNNPQKFIEAAAKVIMRELKLLLRDGVKYHKIGNDSYHTAELFQYEELFAYLNGNAVQSQKSPYHHILYESDIKAEFAQRFETEENIKVYPTLPGWFKIETPIGNYHPDWAAVINRDDEVKIYFGLETKGTEMETKLS
ncbi:type III restriction endonuclease subunit R [Peribacillus saganii]|uniref:Type III restriction endonuclease subunit R n=1 Tax=Peribacillus saganii TaxID=2303992 RepID=A0A372LP04_9BACI|nr:DEAD/DEAH box helicase family protein [Peribacillus saganii]RFU69457.1 type III restriction endonuclease subunit R [Peribacillus saganii]